MSSVKAGQKVNILLVDDRPDKLLALESVLAELGENLVSARSGKQALKQLLEKEFAVILLDIKMPDLDGIETAQMIRQRDSTRHTPIIFFSAFGDVDDTAVKAYSLGAVDFLQTPIAPEALRSKVKVFIDLYRKTEQIRVQGERLREMDEERHRKSLTEARSRLEAETQRNRFFTLSIEMLGVAGFDGRLRELNPSWRQTLGFSDAELKAVPFYEFAHPDDLEDMKAQIQSLTEGATIVRFENRFRSKEGSYHWMGWTAAPFVEEGLIYVFARDITERKRAEEERVRLSQEQAARAAAEAAERRSAFLAMGSAVLTSSLDYKTVLASVARLAIPHLADFCLIDVQGESEEVRRLAVAHIDPGLEESLRDLQVQMRGREDPVRKVTQSGRSELIPEASADILQSMAATPRQLAILEDLRPRSFMIVPLLARGRTVGTITLAASESGRRYGASDLALAEELGRRAALAVDNARLYREAHEANRLKDEFLATVSHELRTPLTAIVGWTTLLRMGQLDRSAFDHAIDTIERNAKAQARLVDDLLDVSRIITGKLRLEMRPTDLIPIIETAINAARPAAQAKDIQLVEHLDPNARKVMGDPNRLQQIVWNLLSNAVKFTPAGGRVEAHLGLEDGEVAIRITDNGVGINSEFLPHVFDRFRQADSSSSRPHSGLGLGLAIVRHLVELHGGMVEADSPGENKGSTFTVRMPLSPPGVEPNGGGPPAGDVASPTPLEGSLSLMGIRVLVVDDELDTRDFLRTCLRQFGADVTAVSSAAEGLEAIQRTPPDVLLSDIGMPGEDGYSFIRKVRHLESSRGGRVPAVALTAYAKKEDGARFLAAGFHVHLPKPVDPDDLVRVVAGITGRTPAG